MKKSALDKMKSEYKPHTIILPSYCPVAICSTKSIAEDMAKARGYKDYRIEKTTISDVKHVIFG
ncbi:hypothetical protein AO825_08365 [Pectobacterium brasiliense]|uniref:hypothetical protein n=1 Tax=Pectobacterium brasiliense TaxID=180957 RepID=UPI0001A444DE|nr:hypothetical protein [Pectobacterium brasiliense]KGA24926.1 hypothetical protein KS44_06345 [Pectobacterium brasiliense]KRF62864.1 hypothetical protein AO825_08365 [Pectobacterium brasiliense]MBN3186071.1 hypothetical protein [Pectobacterium brasiliense]QHG26903.1 hypothetical protein GT391_01895 [Pectobacterium brasiliense]